MKLQSWRNDHVIPILTIVADSNYWIVANSPAVAHAANSKKAIKNSQESILEKLTLGDMATSENSQALKFSTVPVLLYKESEAN